MPRPARLHKDLLLPAQDWSSVALVQMSSLVHDDILLHATLGRMLEQSQGRVPSRVGSLTVVVEVFRVDHQQRAWDLAFAGEYVLVMSIQTRIEGDNSSGLTVLTKGSGSLDSSLATE